MGNLSYSTTKDELVAALSECGEIVDAFLPTDRETGRPRGFAFVTFETPEQAKACIERFNGQEVGGRRINVNEAEERPRRSGPPNGRPRPERSSRPSQGPRDSAGPPQRPSGPRSGPPRPGGFPSGPRSDGPPVFVEPDPSWEEYRGTDWRDGTDDEADDRQWSKKKKRGKGSRRGLRAKKRSL